MAKEEYYKSIAENIIFHAIQVDGKFTDEADFYIVRSLNDTEDPTNENNLIILYDNDRYEVLHILTINEISKIVSTMNQAYIQFPDEDLDE
jgi:hypothetical protein